MGKISSMLVAFSLPPAGTSLPIIGADTSSPVRIRGVIGHDGEIAAAGNNDIAPHYLVESSWCSSKTQLPTNERERVESDKD